MSPRQTLHRLLDQLPERDLPTVARVLEALTATSHDPVSKALEMAPFDDEPDDDDSDGDLTEARRTAKSGHGLSTEELAQELGLA